MSIASNFKSFLGHYANEALSLAEALNTILSGVAFPKQESDQIKNVIDKFTKAAANIEAGLDAIDPTPVVINKGDIEEAVAKALPELLKPLIDAAVAERFAAASQGQAE